MLPVCLWYEMGHSGYPEKKQELCSSVLNWSHDLKNEKKARLYLLSLTPCCAPRGIHLGFSGFGDGPLQVDRVLACSVPCLCKM